MKIIIIGCGKVGYTLARQLSGEGHDLTLVDAKGPALRNAENTLDIMCVEGNGASLRVLKEAGAQKADLVISVTSHDEVNVVCCLMAKKLGARHTIARIRDIDYFRDTQMLKREIDLDMAINPEQAAAQEISRILRLPSAFSVEPFAGGRVELIGFTINETDGIAGVSLMEYNRKNPNGTLLCAVERGGEAIIPNGDFIPRIGDRAYLVGSQKELNRVFRLMNRPTSRVRTVCIIGGSRIAFYLALALERAGMQVTIVEAKRETCEMLAGVLPGTLILEGDGTDNVLQESEGLFRADALVALTGRDEENLLLAMCAQRAGVKKVIAKTTRDNYRDLVKQTQIDSTISPKDITANKIGRYVRALVNSEGSVVESLYKLLGGKIEAVEFTARAGSRLVNVPLKDLPLRKGLLVASIVRGQSSIVPDGNTQILPEDHVIVVAKSLFLHDINEILES
ncbi:MAG: Trk system potassium transporter TrkA [Oscillospiraceae bacterium]